MMAGNRAMVRQAAIHFGRNPDGARKRSLQQHHGEEAEECS